MIWEHTYHRKSTVVDPRPDAYGHAVAQARDGGFVVVGRSSIGSTAAPSVLRVDATGQRLWFKNYYDAVGKGHAMALAPTPQGGLLVAGLFTKAWFLTINANGTPARPIQKKPGLICHDIAALGEGLYVMAGDGFNTHLITVTKIRVGDGVVWSNTYGHGHAFSLTTTRDGGIVVAGTLRNTDTGDHKLYLFKVDARGEVVWKTTRDPGDDIVLFDVEKARNGAIIATGRVHGYRYNTTISTLVLRADAHGRIQ